LASKFPLLPGHFGVAVRSTSAGRLFEQKAWNLEYLRIGGHIPLHRHNHPVHAGWQGTLGGQIFSDGRKRGLSDESRGSACRVVLST